MSEKHDGENKMKEYIHGGDVYRHPGMLDFSANINPLGTPERVIQAAIDSMTQIAHYPDAHQEKLKEALSLFEQVPGEWLICGNGAAELIFALVQTLQPKKALILAPTFAEYEEALRGVGCEVAYEFLREEQEFHVEERILERLTEELDLVFLCNPNNPTGILMDPMLLERIVKRCEGKGIYLAVDECFLDFVEEPKAHSLKHALVSGKKLFLLKAFTKRYAMAGLRLGYGICPDQGLLDEMMHRLQPWNVSIPAQEAGRAALRENAYVEKARKIVEEERIYLMEQLKKMGYPVYDSRANYIFFRGEANLYEKLLEEGIMIRDCGNYPGLKKGYYRIAVRLHGQNEQLLETIRKVRV